jgi:HPr kinase/phosphorylase
VALAGLGLLLRGPSGAGKSSLALRLVEAGAVLIADDLCQIERQGERLIIDLPAAVDAKFRGRIHIRGRGILSLAYFGPAPLGLVADLKAAVPDERPPDRVAFLGLALPRIVLDPRQASAVARLRAVVLGAPEDGRAKL